MNSLKSFVLGGVVSLAATLVQAAPINGSMSLSDGFDPALTGGTGIVSQLNALPIGPTSIAFQPGSVDGDLVGAITYTGFANLWSIDGFAFDISDPDGAANTGTKIYAGNGFEFTLTGVSNIVRDALTCTVDLTGISKCKDSLTFDWVGFITGPGYEQTSFIGNWTGNGACNGTEQDGCTSGVTSSWSSSLIAVPNAVPEPSALALFGLGLLGLGFVRRRRV